MDVSDANLVRRAIDVPQLEDDDPSDPKVLEGRKFADNLLPADQIPQLEPLEPARSEPRHRL